jgi:serine/threonine-protein kinase RsbW
MPADQQATTNGHAPFPEQRGKPRSELDALRATCRRQALVIDTLSEAVGSLRRGAQALKAENADLRAETARTRGRRRSGTRANGRAAGGEHIEVRFALDANAPAAARSAVADFLADRVAPVVLDDAQLLVTELVTNSVRHSGMPATADVIVRVEITPAIVLLDVEDPGRGGAIAPHPPDAETGGGFGLNIVHALSDRWGIEHAAHEGTQVWAQLARTPLSALAS